MSHYHIEGFHHIQSPSLSSSDVGRSLQRLAAVACDNGVYLHVRASGNTATLILSEDWLSSDAAVWESKPFCRQACLRSHGDLDRAIATAMMRIAALRVAA